MDTAFLKFGLISLLFLPLYQLS